MKRYSLYLLLFITPIIMLLTALEIMARRIPNDYSFKHERMITDGKSFDFLVLGNSHAYRGVDPDLMSGTGFNAANISQDHHFDHLIIEGYIDAMPSLKRIFLPLSYGSLGSRLELGKESWRLKNYLIYMNVPYTSLFLDHHLEILNHPIKKLVRMVIDHRSKSIDNMSCSNSGVGIRRTDTGRNIDVDGVLQPDAIPMA